MIDLQINIPYFLENEEEQQEITSFLEKGDNCFDFNNIIPIKPNEHKVSYWDCDGIKGGPVMEVEPSRVIYRFLVEQFPHKIVQALKARYPHMTHHYRIGRELYFRYGEATLQMDCDTKDKEGLMEELKTLVEEYKYKANIKRPIPF